MSFPHLIYYGSVYSVLLPLVAGLFQLRRLEREAFWILVLVAVASIPQIIPLFLEDFQWANVLYNGYTVVELVLLLQVFRVQSTQPSFRSALHISAAIYGAIGTALIGSMGMQDEFINELVCLNGVIYLVWCLLFIRLLASEKVELIFDTGRPFFWFFTGILIYAPCTIIVLALDSRINADPTSVLQQLRTIHGIFNISMYCCFAIGMLVRQKIPALQTTKTQHESID